MQGSSRRRVSVMQIRETRGSIPVAWGLAWLTHQVRSSLFEMHRLTRLSEDLPPPRRGREQNGSWASPGCYKQNPTDWWGGECKASDVSAPQALFSRLFHHTSTGWKNCGGTCCLAAECWVLSVTFIWRYPFHKSFLSCIRWDETEQWRWKMDVRWSGTVDVEM